MGTNVGRAHRVRSTGRRLKGLAIVPPLMFIGGLWYQCPTLRALPTLVPQFLVNIIPTRR